MPFGQCVIGPPGSGKSTYCHGMYQFLTALNRNPVVINLDPANDNLPYPCKVNIAKLITLDEVMQVKGLGPNGGMIYCMEYLEENMSWLFENLDALKTNYLLFDCPGQVELYTHHPAMRRILTRLQAYDIRLCAVHLVDAHYCTTAAGFISATLLSLKVMLQMELAHVNILSKIDLLNKYDDLAFDLEYYTEVRDLSYLVEQLDAAPFSGRFPALNKALSELIHDYDYVSFMPLAVEDKNLMMAVLKEIDRANGYGYQNMDPSMFTPEMLKPFGHKDDELEKSRMVQKVEEQYGKK